MFTDFLQSNDKTGSRHSDLKYTFNSTYILPQTSQIMQNDSLTFFCHVLLTSVAINALGMQILNRHSFQHFKVHI